MIPVRARSLALFALAACTPTPGGKGPADAEDDSAAVVCVDAAVATTNGTSGELPLALSFTGASACGGEWSAAWDFGDGATAEGDAVAHTFLASGVHTVTLTLTGADGATLSTALDVTVTPAACPEVQDVVQVGTVANEALNEASGLAEGRANPGLLWSHNDSGDTPRLFALDRDGADRGTFLLDGAPAGDWEDLAIGEDADGTPVLYVGDIGAGGTERDTLLVHVVPEPAVSGGGEALVTDAWSFELVFPDTPALDAAAMAWDPATGDLYLAATEAAGTGIYRAAAPFSEGAVVLLERVAGFALDAEPFSGSPTATGAAISPLGDRLVIRTGTEAWLWRRDRAADLDAAWASEPCPLPLAPEPRGEAIAFSADGAGYYTTSEEASQPIWYTAFVPAEPPCDGIAPRVVVSGALEVGADLAFGIDATCVPAGIVSAAWDFGDTDASEEFAPTHAFLGSGTWEVTLTIEDGDGESATVTTPVTIAPASCPTVGVLETWGTVVSDEITEASGLAHSTLNPGVVWTHNDSSDTPRLFALSQSGGHLGEYTVVTDNRDWEDLSRGWDDTLGAPALYVGDFGDNGEVREFVTVLVVPEPTVSLADVPITAEIADFSTLTLLYPDAAHNAETLMHDPVTGDLYIVTKDYSGETSIFRKPAPHEDGTTTTLEHVADLLFGEDPLPGNGATTGGDISPRGDRIAIRTYSHAWMWRRDGSFPFADAFSGTPCDLRAPTERQGEAITFTTDGAGYLTLSEGGHQPLYYTPLP